MLNLPRSYNPGNWYWIVAGSTTQVYSSAAGNYVPVSNSTYLAWLALGYRPTKIDTEANLADVLSSAGQALPPSTSPSDTLKDSQFDNIPRAVEVWAFAIENRVRALEGQASRTPTQFKNYVLGLPGW